MELFGTRSVSDLSVHDCAELVIASVPAIMSTFRAEMRAGKPTELSLPQFRTLIKLSFHPARSISDIADHLGIALSTASQLIDGLVKRGYVTRVSDADDRRRATLTLTASGRTMLEAVRAQALAHMEERLAALTMDERRAVADAMQMLGRVFQRGAGLSDTR
jgi:DNA-binding MarR family transcriptional regulator